MQQNKINFSSIIKALPIIFFCVFLCGCSLTKYVPDGEYLVSKVRVVSDNKDVKPSESKSYIKQEPNHKTFGFIPLPLGLYSLSGQDTTSWINNFLKRSGTAPVIYDADLTDKSEKELKKMLINKGYMEAKVVSSVNTKKKKASVEYLVSTGNPMRINSFKYVLQSDSASDIIRNESKNSLIKSGMNLDRNLLEKERQRLTSVLRNNGYWSFIKDNISYMADTMAASYDVDLELNLLPRKYITYRIDRVVVNTDYNVGLQNTSVARDTINVNGIEIVYGSDKYLRAGVIVSNCFITPGILYTDRIVDKTYSSFSRLKILKYINIRFEESSQGMLNCYITMSPGKNQSMTTEIEGTNSAGDFGFAAAVTYQHRNIFKGSETFTTKIRGGYENLTGNVVSNLVSDNYQELGVETSVSFPKFMFPIGSEEIKRMVRANTEFSASYNYQHRPEYTRVIAGGGIKYNWFSKNNRVKHLFDLMDISYVYLPFRSKSFVESIINRNPTLYSSYTDHLITRSGYSIYYSSFAPGVKNRDITTFRATTEFAGNILTAASKILNLKKYDDGYRVVGLRYEQYWKMDVDYAYTKVINDKNSLAFRIAGGVGIPYGNSNLLPYEKRYYSGGANSVRGWSVRTLGPGRYKSDNPELDYFNQCGDVRFDASVEYRSKLIWKLEMAAFIDAGNVWTYKEYDEQQGGAFKFNSFYEEIALSWGLGVRLDFDFFILRMDMGIKAYDPSRVGNKPWLIKDPLNFSNQTYHFAVGYPF